MASRKRKTARAMPQRPPKEHGAQAFYTPFKDLDQQLTFIPETCEGPPPVLEKPSTMVELPENPQSLFHAAMAGVEPLYGDEAGRIPPPPPVKRAPRFMVQEDKEVLTHLVGLVNGEAPFEVWYSDEYVDGAVVGLSPEIVKKLKRGDFSYQDHIDLHGCNREEARDRVNRFIKRSFSRKLRCVLVVSGRGLNSRERQPVLKQELVRWLTHTPLRRIVLAFASARSYDGGAGAFYVLLRRKEGKAPFVMPAG
jgi:DNA-nicking Smr family endonuclease